MTAVKPIRTRGRPRTITRERIAEAGITMGLPNITFVGVASALGISHMALYKHVPNLEALKQLVAEEIFKRWVSPPLNAAAYPDGLSDYLHALVVSLCTLVKTHHGLTPYLLRKSNATPSMLAKIDAHHRQIAHTFGIATEQARRLLTTVAFHCIAVADTVYLAAGEALAPDVEQLELEHELAQGLSALIVGALALLKRSA